MEYYSIQRGRATPSERRQTASRPYSGFMSDSRMKSFEQDAFAACLPEPMQVSVSLFQQRPHLWPQDWPDRVDAYLKEHGGTRTDLFRKIIAITGHSINGLYTRYRSMKKQNT